MKLLHLLIIRFGIFFVNEIPVLLKHPAANTKHVSLLCTSLKCIGSLKTFCFHLCFDVMWIYECSFLSLSVKNTSYSIEMTLIPHSHPCQFPPEMTLLESQLNFQTYLKSNFLFTPISNIYTSKGFQDDWSQVNNRQTFTNRHLLIPIN